MATFSATLHPYSANPTKVTALAATTSSAELVFNNFATIGIVATGNCQVRFGTSGMAAADNTAWFIAQGATPTFDLGGVFDRIRVFNPNAGAIDVYVIQLVKS